VVGTFWIQQHLRGNSSSGTIVKDYKIASERRDA
jgi:hypothetical protein